MIVAAPGHRPKFLKTGYNLAPLTLIAKAWLGSRMPEAVISGMALGWDQAVAIAAIELGIETWAYLPHVGQADTWPMHSQTAYQNLQQFTVTATNSASTMTISPAIYINGPRQNVSAASGAQLTSTSNVTTAAIVWVGAASTSYVHNLMYHRDAFTFATAALPIYGAAEKCVVKTLDGISLRVWQDGDIRNDELLTRIDILYGYAAIRPAWACRITS